LVPLSRIFNPGHTGQLAAGTRCDLRGRKEHSARVVLFFIAVLKLKKQEKNYDSRVCFTLCFNISLHCLWTDTLG